MNEPIVVLVRSTYGRANCCACEVHMLVPTILVSFLLECSVEIWSLWELSLHLSLATSYFCNQVLLSTRLYFLTSSFNLANIDGHVSQTKLRWCFCIRPSPYLLWQYLHVYGSGTSAVSDAAGSWKESDNVKPSIAWASRTIFAQLFDELVKCIQGISWKPNAWTQN